MPYLNVDDVKIYYKEYGEGDCIVFLNGVAMSTSSWSPFKREISKNHRMLLIDLMDQGRSQGHIENYTIEDQADILKKALDKLNIEKIHLVGMSYGGKVALTFSLKYMDMINSLSLVNTDSYTTKYNLETGKACGLAAATLDGELFSSVLLPYMYSMNYFENNAESMKEKKRFFTKIMNKNWCEALHRTLLSSKSYNVMDDIQNIRVPTLIITSDEDITIPKKSQEILHKEIKGSKWVVVKGAGHAIMYEKPEEFMGELTKFINFISKIK